MIARALGVIALVASVGIVTPWTSPVPAVGAATEAAAPDPQRRLHGAIEDAARRRVPGAAASDWRLLDVERSTPDVDGHEFIVATGVLGTAGANDTTLRLTGRYHPATGELARVSYRLQPATPLASPAATDWSVQGAVQQAFAEVLPDQPVDFALASSQSERVEGGGRRFEGAGIGTFDDGDARFVAFTLTLSARGELVEFDYRTHDRGDEHEDAGFVALH